MLIVESISINRKANPTEGDEIVPDNGLSAAVTKL